MPVILLIEDNDANRDMLARRLQRAGYDVLLARDAAEGLDVAQARRPDLVVLDMRLPDMSGWDATRLLKHDELTRHIPVLALTAHAMPGDRDRAMRAGCDDYDVKPVDLPRLLEKIRALLRASASRAREHDAPDAPQRPLDSNGF